MALPASRVRLRAAKPTRKEIFVRSEAESRQNISSCFGRCRASSGSLRTEVHLLEVDLRKANRHIFHYRIVDAATGNPRKIVLREMVAVFAGTQTRARSAIVETPGAKQRVRKGCELVVAEGINLGASRDRGDVRLSAVRGVVRPVEVECDTKS